MKFMCVGIWGEPTDLDDIGAKFLNDGDLIVSEGMTLLDRWHDLSSRKFWLITEVTDVLVFQTWAAKWSDEVNFEVYPALDDEQCGAILSKVVKQ
ncbi:MAG: DUF3303 domain-containing protein [Hyphomicrobiaceae bacterium]